MESIGKRIAALREAKNWSQEDLGKAAGVSQSTIAAVEVNPNRKPRNLLQIAAALEVDPYYLETGTSLAPGGSGVAAYVDESELGEDYIWIDRYNLNLSAGAGELQWVVHEKDPIAFRARFFQAKRLDSRNCRALYVRGKSMEPYLMDGDTVVIDTSKTKPEDGEVFAVYYDDQYWIKTINVIPNGLRLVSMNPSFQAIDLVGEQLSSIRILGKQVWRGG